MVSCILRTVMKTALDKEGRLLQWRLILRLACGHWLHGVIRLLTPYGWQIVVGGLVAGLASWSLVVFASTCMCINNNNE